MDDTLSEIDLDDVVSWDFVVENNEDESSLNKTLQPVVDWVASLSRVSGARS